MDFLHPRWLLGTSSIDSMMKICIHFKCGAGNFPKAFVVEKKRIDKD